LRTSSRAVGSHADTQNVASDLPPSRSEIKGAQKMLRTSQIALKALIDSTLSDMDFALQKLKDGGPDPSDPQLAPYLNEEERQVILKHIAAMTTLWQGRNYYKSQHRLFPLNAQLLHEWYGLSWQESRSALASSKDEDAAMIHEIEEHASK
jgi:hypothetical protein